MASRGGVLEITRGVIEGVVMRLIVGVARGMIWGVTALKVEKRMVGGMASKRGVVGGVAGKRGVLEVTGGVVGGVAGRRGILEVGRVAGGEVLEVARRKL